jgi:hypothetical protein
MDHAERDEALGPELGEGVARELSLDHPEAVERAPCHARDPSFV